MAAGSLVPTEGELVPADERLLAEPRLVDDDDVLAPDWAMFEAARTRFLTAIGPRIGSKMLP